jgi:hypothetical protein
MKKRITKKPTKIKQTKITKKQTKPIIKKTVKRKKKEVIVPKKQKKKIVSVVLVPKVVVEEVKKPATRGRKKSTQKMYFTNDTEDAIELFNNTESQEEREKIFQDKIKYPFEKLVENIFNTFKFSYFETGPLDVQKETISHLVANIHKFEKSKGKAFSYFSIVAKHYLIFLNNSNYKRFNQSVEIGEDREDHTVQLQAEDKHYKNVEMSDFMRLMIEYWEVNVGKIFSKQRDLNIANAVIELFRNSDIISMFNKKALYLYIREISNCKTQQITKIINKMKLSYVKIRQSYEDDGEINIQNEMYR